MIIFSDDAIMSHEECVYCIEKLVGLFFDTPKVTNIYCDEDDCVNFTLLLEKMYEYMYDKDVSISWYDLNYIRKYVESHGLVENKDYYTIRMRDNPVCIGVLTYLNEIT